MTSDGAPSFNVIESLLPFLVRFNYAFYRELIFTETTIKKSSTTKWSHVIGSYSIVVECCLWLLQTYDIFYEKNVEKYYD